eukprot:6455173-Amphidinium_carterae.1
MQRARVYFENEKHSFHPMIETKTDGGFLSLMILARQEMPLYHVDALEACAGLSSALHCSGRPPLNLES